MGADSFSGVADGAEAFVTVEALSSFGGIWNKWNSLTVNTSINVATLSLLTWSTSNSGVTITDCKHTATGELVIPDTIEGNPVTSIGNFAFHYNYYLTSIIIPDSVTTIGYQAFRQCDSLASITFLGAAPTVGTNAFSGLADEAEAIVTIEALSSFGGDIGENWNGLTVDVSDSDKNEAAALFAELSQRPTQASYDAAVATARTDGRGDVTGDPASYDLVTQASYNAAVATARTDGRGDITGDPASYDLVTQASYDAMVAERDNAVTERDARPTLEQVRDGRPGSVLLSVDSETGSVVLDFTVEESEDLITWTPVAGPGVSQTLTLPEGKRFYRFAD